MTEKKCSFKRFKDATRDEESRLQTNWQPPALLDAPEVRPNGSTMVATRFRRRFRQRIKKKSEGWEPRKAKL